MLRITGPLLPVVSFLGRLPTAMIQMGSVLLVTETSGSLAVGGVTGCALALGQVALGPLVGRLADRRGQRTVVLALSLLNATAILVFTLAALLRLPLWALVPLGTLAGATVPGIGPLGRARVVAIVRRRGASNRMVNAVMSMESTMDELSFVLGPAAVGLAAVVGYPAHAFVAGALLVGVCGTAFALHPTGRAPGTEPPRARGQAHTSPRARGEAKMSSRARDPRIRPPLPPMPREVHVVRVGLVCLGVLLGACGAGITALSGELASADQAGLVYAAMGVTSAISGLSMGAVPERITLATRWRAVTALAAVLSLPLIGAGSMTALYLAVVLFGAAFAPNMITGFALTERAVPRVRLAEGMTVANGCLVGGQAVTLAVAGRLAESYGAWAAFTVGSTAAVAAFGVALYAGVRGRGDSGGTVPRDDVRPAAAAR
ncbi:MFS transporter [Streptomyces triticagri]|uniref:MFS transporter n=1 Tax=Streptomyces triticagri TaxID=2293568 RepID=A0A372LYB9_9ACTN|nr:MFS transporter [Streptomyces triticagri]